MVRVRYVSILVVLVNSIVGVDLGIWFRVGCVVWVRVVLNCWWLVVI